MPLLRNALTLCDRQEQPLQQIKFRPAERSNCAVTLGNQPVAEGFAVFFIAVVDKYNAGLARNRIDPLKKSVPVGVPACAVQGADLGADRDLLTK